MNDTNNNRIGLQLLHSMMRIRTVEEEIAAKYSEGWMRCPTHLCTGQESVAAAAGLALRKSDLAVSTHRAHGHYIGKGGDMGRMLAEICGKVDGCSAGNGGSMHLIDESVGFMGSTAIVGSTIPVGVGLGLSLSLKGTDDVSVIFLGDGAVEEGVFYESANFAVVKNLPVVFLCENNLYSVYSNLGVRQPAGRKIHEMVAGIGLDTDHGDGNDTIAVYESISKAVAKVRAKGGPAFLEYSTYRWREHCGPNFDNDIGYRTEQEYLEWKERDPIPRLRKRLTESGEASDEEIDALQAEVDREVAGAFEFAKNSAHPEPGQLAGHVFK